MRHSPEAHQIKPEGTLHIVKIMVREFKPLEQKNKVKLNDRLVEK